MNERTEESNDCIHSEILLSPTMSDISLEKYIYVSMSIYILHTCYRHVEYNMMNCTTKKLLQLPLHYGINVSTLIIQTPSGVTVYHKNLKSKSQMPGQARNDIDAKFYFQRRVL